MSDFIFSSPSSFFASPPLYSKEKVIQKQHLRMTYTYALVEVIFFHRGEKQDKETRKINRSILSESCFVFRQLGAIKLVSLT